MEEDNLFPIAIEVKEGKTYRWCGCGQSKTQPFCDRQGCGDQCVEYTAEINEVIHFCACKQTADPPFCDGSHAKLLMEHLKKKKSS